jgi:tRNA threonylcarbamoyladenosine biosynthesis protein TsaE
MEKTKRVRNIVSKSEEDTMKAGEELAQGLKPGSIVLIYGNLGYGKTTFVKGVAKGLGIKTRIVSPTFTIIRTHNNTHHIDLYRIEDYKNLGLEEILEDPTSIKLIEWPERLRKPPGKRIEVKFTMNKDNTRTINIYEHE